MNNYYFVLLAFLLAGCTEKKADVTSTTNSPYTLEECHAFWDSKLAPIITQQLIKGETPYPEINHAFSNNFTFVVSRYGNPKVNLSTYYHPISPLIEGASGIFTNVATTTIYIPSIIDSYIALRNQGSSRFEEAFKTHVLVLYMHELDHLTHDPDIGNATHVDTDNEALIWARTVEEVIEPLIEKYQAKILRSDWRMYNAWTNAGKISNSTIWLNAIRELHRGVDGKTLPAPKL
ncbi:MAG: hypothetical protein EXS46_03550 [Candidatus Taylorbacteria bacterium]|nr:hypothetical protein [Candidatus Taylorbacteria bacterium]